MNNIITQMLAKYEIKNVDDEINALKAFLKYLIIDKGAVTSKD